MKNKRLLFFFAFFILGKGFALPQGADVSHGQAEFRHADSQNLVIHTSDKAIINYKEFNIAQRESVEFIQPSSSSGVLNRISGGNPSEILGALKSNGKVILVNPSGVYFGPDATVSTGSLIASVLDIKDQDFLSDRYEFTLSPNGKNSSIINRGILSSPEGIIALLAPRILNEGMIATQVGKVFLGGAEKVTLDFHGDGMISFVLEGEIEDALIHNQGTIDAAGGTVMLRMKAANRAIQEVINTDGIAVATQMIEENGIISLVDSSYICGESVSIEGNNCSLYASGKIDASGEKGGTIELLADQIYLTGVEIDASGDFGGGTVLIGGDYQGSGDTHQAKWTYMDNSSTIWADAKTEGNGGKVIVWSNDNAIFDGSIFARGGAFSGNGGLVETSGKNQFGTRTGHVNTLAPHGKVGNWLLDPLTINVVTGGGGTLAQAADCTDVATNLSIDPATINAAASVVTLCASSSITVTNGISMTNPNVGLVFTANNGAAVPTTLSANITTRGGSISFSGNVTLGASVTLDTTSAAAAGSDVSFGGTINGTTGGTESLTVTCGTAGSVNVAGTIGVTTALDALSITAHGGVVLNDIGAGSNGANATTITSNAGVKTIGTTYRTSSLTCTAPLTIAANTTIVATNAISITGAIDADAAATRTLSITSSASSISLSSPIGANNSISGTLTVNAATTLAIDSVGSNAAGAGAISFTAPTSITLNGGTYFTTDAQTFTGPVILGTNVSMRSAGGVTGITFSSTINSSGAAGSFGLTTVGSPLTFNGAIGNTTDPGFLNSNAASILVNASPIETTGIQNYTGSITIAQNTSFINTGMIVSAGINTSVAGSTLTLSAAGGPVSVGSAIGSTATAMGAITITAFGGITLNGVGTMTASTGALALTSRAIYLNSAGPGSYQALSHAYTGDVIAGSTLVINSTNNVSISGTFDSVASANATITSTAGAISILGASGSINAFNTLTLNAATTISIDSISGGTTGGTLAGFTLTAPTSITLNGGGYLTSGGAQTFTGPVIVGVPTLIRSTNQAISFSSTINGGSNLFIDPGTSSVTFNGQLGNTSPIGALTVGTVAGGSIIINTTTISTTRPQNYISPVTLNQNVTVSATNNSSISFDNTVNGNAVGRTLTATTGGAVSFAAAIGSTATSMDTVTITGTAGVTFNGVGTGTPLTGALSATSTTGITLAQGTYQALSQTYIGNVTLNANTTMTSTNNISILGTLEGNARTFTATSTAGSITLGGAIGSRNALTSVTLNAATTIDVDSLAGGGNTAGSSTGLSFTAPTSITLNGSAYFTSGGAQTYTGPVSVNNSTVLTSTNQAITFSSTINGANALSIDQGTNTATFNGTIGNTTPLTSLSVGTSVAGAISLNTTGVTTTGAQNYGSPATLLQNLTFTTTNSPVSFTSTINGNAAGRTVTIAAGNGAVVVSGAIGSTATAMGAITITGNGGTTLSGIGTGAATTGAAAVTSTAGILLNQGTYQANSQTYTGNVTLGNSTTMTSTNNISITGAIDGAAQATQSLSATSTAGSITLDGAIGSRNALSNLTLNAATTIAIDSVGRGGNAAGSTGGLSLTAPTSITLNGSGYFTSGGAQSYTGPVILGTSTVLASTNQNITFSTTVNGAESLTMAAGTGAITFTGAVGGTTRLGIVTINNANGVTANSTFSSAAINQTASTGANLFTAAVDTNTIAGIILNGTTFTFNSTVTTTNAGPLSINNSSTLTLPALAYTIGGAFTQIGAGAVSTAANITTTNGLISFAGPVSLAGNINLNSSAGGSDIAFHNTLNGANTLTLTAGIGNIIFDQAVGGITPLTQVTATGRSVDQNSSLHTTGATSYTVTGYASLAGDLTSDASNVTITGNLLRDTVANATITAGNNISITGTLDADAAGRNLTLAATGSATLGNVIGDSTPLNNFTVTANTISIADIGDGTAGIAGTTTLTSTNAIAFTGNTYLANQQNYTGTSFNLAANTPTSFTAATNSIQFAGGPINLGNNGSLIIHINNGNFTAPEITGNGSQSNFTFCPNGTIDIGKIDPLAVIYQIATNILITETIEASSVTLIATAGDITNDVGGPFLVTATDYISMNAIGGVVGTALSPISIMTNGPAFAGAATTAYFTGTTGDDTVHCLPSNPPTQLFFNGVDIGCAGTPVPPTPTPTPTPPSPIDNLEGRVRKAFYVAGLYSFYYNLAYPVYFERDLVNMDSIITPNYLFYGKRL